MTQVTVEIIQWLRAPTSSLSQDTPHYSILNCFHSKKKKKNYSYISNVDPWELSPSVIPQSPQPLQGSMWVWGPGDHRKGSRQVLWEPKPLAEQISGT